MIRLPKTKTQSFQTVKFIWDH